VRRLGRPKRDKKRHKVIRVWVSAFSKRVPLPILHKAAAEAAVARLPQMRRRVREMTRLARFPYSLDYVYVFCTR
jgi:hypothetical protein